MPGTRRQLSLASLGVSTTLFYTSNPSTAGTDDYFRTPQPCNPSESLNRSSVLVAYAPCRQCDGRTAGAGGDRAGGGRDGTVHGRRLSAAAISLGPTAGQRGGVQ